MVDKRFTLILTGLYAGLRDGQELMKAFARSGGIAKLSLVDAFRKYSSARGCREYAALPGMGKMGKIKKDIEKSYMICYNANKLNT